MTKNYKKVLINSDSFVGISPRSKSGCLACRKKKKKCDEIHPICGGCMSKNTKCEWKPDTSKKQKCVFDIKPIMEAQKEMLKQRFLVDNKTKSTHNSSNNSKHENFNKPKKITQKSLKKELNINSISKPKRKPTANSKFLGAVNLSNPTDIAKNTLVSNKNSLTERFLTNEISRNNLNISIDSNTLNPSYLVKSSKSNTFIDSIINTSDVDEAVDKLLGDDGLRNGFISNVLKHMKSPDFNPTTNYLDLSINSALQNAQNIMLNENPKNNSNVIADNLIRSNSIGTELSVLSLPSFSPFEQFVNLQNSPCLNENNDKENENKVRITSQRIINDTGVVDGKETKTHVGESEKPNKIDKKDEEFTVVIHEKNDEENDNQEVEEDDDQDVEEDDDQDVEEIDNFHPMDESQLLENLYTSDSDLINVFKSKKLHPYLRPAVHLLLSKNNALKIISPSSPIMRQLDSTGRLFLENYVSNLAMNQLDIGNNQFFLDFALSQASNDPAILYCLVAWGGMFLVGRDNEEANKYFYKGIRLGQKRRKLLKNSGSNSKFDNKERVNLLVLYCLYTCAEISTGDVARWFELLLQCKDILSDYGNLQQFIHENENSKVANWILSNIFNHDLLCTRTLDYGTVFSIYDYKEVFTAQKSLQRNDYGLDPFYGLCQNLYLLLGEVANNRKLLKASSNFKPMNGLKRETDKKYLKVAEDSWFQIFDSQISSCKPQSEMLKLLMTQDNDGKLLEYHLTWYELTQISMRIYIRISFKEIEFDNKEIQKLRCQGIKLFKILVSTKLQSLLGLSLLMLGMTSITQGQREIFKDIYDGFLKNYQIVNVQVCWEIIKQVWKNYDNKVLRDGRHYVDWSEIVKTMGWNCCFT